MLELNILLAVEDSLDKGHSFVCNQICLHWFHAAQRLHPTQFTMVLRRIRKGLTAFVFITFLVGFCALFYQFTSISSATEKG